MHSALEMLLWVAVCATENKMEHIQLIFQMDDDNAAELKEVVQDQQKKVKLIQEQKRDDEEVSEDEPVVPNEEEEEEASRLAEAALAPNDTPEHQNLKEEVSKLRLQVQAGEKRYAFNAI